MRVNVGDGVDSLAQSGVDVAVAAARAQNRSAKSRALINRDMGKHVGWSIGAVGRLQAKRGWIVLIQRWRLVLIEFAACAHAKLVHYASS